MSYNTSPPTPPKDANLEEMHKYLLTLHSWTKGMFQTGVQSTQVPESVLDKMVSQNDLSQSGKIFYDTTNNVMKKALIVGGNLTVTTF